MAQSWICSFMIILVSIRHVYVYSMRSSTPKAPATGFAAVSPISRHNDTAPTALTVSLGDMQVFRADLTSGNLEVSPALSYTGMSDYPPHAPQTSIFPPPKSPVRQQKHMPMDIVKVPKVSHSADFSTEHIEKPLPSQFAGKNVTRVGSTYADTPNSPVFLPELPLPHDQPEPRRRTKAHRLEDATMTGDSPSPKQWMYDLYYYGKPRSTDNFHRKLEKAPSTLFSEEPWSSLDPANASFFPPRKPDLLYNTSPSRHFPVDYSVGSPYHPPEMVYDPTYYKQPKPYKHSSGPKKSFTYDDVIAAYHPATSSPYKVRIPAIVEDPMMASGSVNQDAFAVYHSKSTIPYNAEEYRKFPYGGYSASRSGLSTASFAPSRPRPFDNSEEAIDITFELPFGGTGHRRDYREPPFERVQNSRQFENVPNVPNPRKFGREPTFKNADIPNASPVNELRGFPAEGQTPQASHTAQHIDRGTFPSFTAIDGAAGRGDRFGPEGSTKKLTRPHPGFGYLADGEPTFSFPDPVQSLPLRERQQERSRPQRDFLGPMLRSYVAKGGDIGSFELFDLDKFDRRAAFLPEFL
ncbi:hypothetical protein RvY_02442 [Ramazzottius varieornatus]|uniref:Uncharacterized protein n=1 Tax=Ramazzottius varieornatus TaxID=947166 RepID=A0A1D1UQK6_RAMVA|nr:hypothetical protein RvY_02442 [Ramazzottius varieornatus]